MLDMARKHADGVVDENIGRANLCDDRVAEAGDARIVREIEWKRDGLAGRRAYVLCHGLAPFETT
jgi:hypothetical protein